MPPRRPAPNQELDDDLPLIVLQGDDLRLGPHMTSHCVPADEGDEDSLSAALQFFFDGDHCLARLVLRGASPEGRYLETDTVLSNRPRFLTQRSFSTLFGPELSLTSTLVVNAALRAAGSIEELREALLMHIEAEVSTGGALRARAACTWQQQGLRVIVVLARTGEETDERYEIEFIIPRRGALAVITDDRPRR